METYIKQLIEDLEVALHSFKDEYLLSFVNIESPNYEKPDERVLEKAENLTIISVGQRPTKFSVGQRPMRFSVGQRPTDYNENKLTSPERAKSQKKSTTSCHNHCQKSMYI